MTSATSRGGDPDTNKAYATPKAVADRLQYLYTTAVELGGLVGQEGEISMQLVNLLTKLWPKEQLGVQTLEHLCKQGVHDEKTQRHVKYQPKDLTIELVGANQHARTGQMLDPHPKPRQHPAWLAAN